MKNLILLSALIGSLVSCKKSDGFRTSTQNAESDSTAILNDPKNNLNIQTRSFIEIDSSGILMFPLEMGQSNKSRNSDYKEIPDGNYWNIIFLDTHTNEYHLLSEQKMLIFSYDYKYQEKSGIESNKDLSHIFYTVRSEDFNQDKLLNRKDPMYLYVSNMKGQNFRQISPKNQHIINWSYVESSNKILMIVQKDSDKNGEFDDYDEILTYELILGEDEKPREIFNQDFKNKLKILYDRDCKKNDKDY